VGEVLPCGVGIGRRTGKQRRRAKHRAGGACTAHPFLSSFTALPATINHGYGRLSCRFGALSTRRGASSSQAGCGAAAAGRAVLGAAATPTSYRLHAACLRSDRLASFLTGKRSPLTSAPVLTEPPDIPTGRCQSVACRGRSCSVGGTQ